MRIRWTTWIMMATGVLTLIAGVAAGGGSAHAATTGSAAASAASAAAAPRAAGFVAEGQLNDVAATAAGNAWAVGSTGALGRTKTLILHWNGKKWELA